jgi:hypothetical protein
MLLIILSMLMLPGADAPAAQAPADAPDAVTVQRAQAWLTAVYPALQRGDVNVAVYGDGVTSRLVVTAQSAHRVPGDRTSAPVLLVADLHRSKVTGRLEAMQARGSLVRSNALAALQSSVAAHPAWTSTDVAAAITAAGGHYPPGTRAALLAQLAPLADLFGGTATLEQATFVNTTAVGPVWLVDVSVGARAFRIAVEPFDGQVIGLAAR